jgi:pyridoxine kinase
MKITNEAEAIEAMEKLHGKGVSTVVITSTDLYGVPGELALLASHKPRDSSDSATRRFRIRMPALEGYFTGTGDLFAAVRLPHASRRAPERAMRAC